MVLATQPEAPVFSTYVEVILTLKFPSTIWLSILHVCGGDPIGRLLFVSYLLYSPRMWRWSHMSNSATFKVRVFSTYVEVILINRTLSMFEYGILHVCGGDPAPTLISSSESKYSPRMWRWSCPISVVSKFIWVFSTYVEVILLSSSFAVEHFCILHVCGGDPIPFCA